MIYQILSNLNPQTTSCASLEDPLLKTNIDQIFSQIFSHLGNDIPLTLEQKKIIVDERTSFIAMVIKSDICKQVAVEAFREFENEDISCLYRGRKLKITPQTSSVTISSLVCSLFNNDILHELPVWEKFKSVVKDIVNLNTIRYSQADHFVPTLCEQIRDFSGYNKKVEQTS